MYIHSKRGVEAKGVEAGVEVAVTTMEAAEVVAEITIAAGAEAINRLVILFYCEHLQLGNH